MQSKEGDKRQNVFRSYSCDNNLHYVFSLVLFLNPGKLFS